MGLSRYASSFSNIHETVRARRTQHPSPESTVRGPVLDRAAQQMLLTEILRAMWLTFEQMFKAPYTIMYPQEKGPISPRFRGEHALRRYPTGINIYNFIYLLLIFFSY